MVNLYVREKGAQDFHLYTGAAITSESADAVIAHSRAGWTAFYCQGTWIEE